MNFTYSENVNTTSQSNNNNNEYNLTNNENNIINKYKIDNKTKFNDYMNNLLPEINYIHIDDIKTDNEGNEFKLKINNEEIFFSNNTFYIYNDEESTIYSDYLYNHHINKKNIIKDDNKDNNEEHYERNIPFYNSTYKSNIYKNLLIYKISSTITINFSYIFNLLKISLPLLKIVYTTNYCYLIYNKPNYIIDSYNYYYKQKIINNELYLLNNKYNNILNNKNYYNTLLRMLCIFKKLNILFNINIRKFYYSKDKIFIYYYFYNINYNSYNYNTYIIENNGEINLIEEIDANEYIKNLFY